MIRNCVEQIAHVGRFERLSGDLIFGTPAKIGAVPPGYFIDVTTGGLEPSRATIGAEEAASA